MVAVCRMDLDPIREATRRLPHQPGNLDGDLGESGAGFGLEDLEGFLRDLEGRADQGWGVKERR